jgi:hypothetical protein
MAQVHEDEVADLQFALWVLLGSAIWRRAQQLRIVRDLIKSGEEHDVTALIFGKALLQTKFHFLYARFVPTLLQTSTDLCLRVLRRVIGGGKLCNNAFNELFKALPE